MEGKAIKEESVSVGSPCSPLALPPSGKENRRVGSPLLSSDIITRSRTKVLSKENSHHHHSHHHHHRMTESPKVSTATGVGIPIGNGSPSPPVSSVNLSVSTASSQNKSSTGISQHSHLPHSGPSTSHVFHHHQFSSPHSTTGTTVSPSSILNGSVRRTPSPPLNVNGRERPDGSSANNSASSAATRTPSSSSSNNSNNSGASAASTNNLGHSNTSNAIGGNSRLLIKIKRFLGTLLHFGHDISPDVGERVRGSVFSLVSGHLSIEEFHHTLQEVTSFPLRPFVLPFLRAHLPLLQREINHAARIAKQSPLSYVQTHEQVIIDTGSSPGEPCDIFHSEASDLSLPTKRKASESFYENGEISSESSSGYTSTPKRHHTSGSMFSPPFFLSAGVGGASSAAEFREYYTTAAVAAAAGGYLGIPSAGSHGHGTQHHGHDSITTQPSTPSSNGVPKGGPEDEWKNIHVMLGCILSMVEKTKRALGILQSRAAHTEQNEGGSSSSWLRRPSLYSALENSEDLKRQVNEMMAQAFRANEDRVSQVERRADEAIQEVKRQALVEVKRAVAAAEARACEVLASERARLGLERAALLDSRRNPRESPVIVGAAPTTDAETCWNCGRKAHETCSGCNTAKYCSSFCQHKDWESHHAVCGRNGANPERTSSASGVPAPENKSSHPHTHLHENNNSNSPPINVSNPSPERHSPGSNP